MGISLQLVNHTDLFHRHSQYEPVIINDFAEASEEDKDKFNRLIYTKYSANDLLSNLPTCVCGEITGERNVGTVCPNCRSVVVAALDQELQSLVWMRAPKGVKALINPTVWTMLTEKFRRGGFDIIRWFCDTSYKPQVKTPPVLDAVLALNFDRGYNNFVDNFYPITDALFNLSVFKKKGVVDPLQILLREDPERIFTQYLPLPNRTLLVLEESNVGANGSTYVDPLVPAAVDSIRIMTGIDTPLSTLSLRSRELRAVKAVAQLAEYHDGFTKTKLAKKEGIPRKNIYGCRPHFVFRAVISSLTGAHDYDELHISWGVAVSVLRIHLLNKLFRRGFTPNQAIGHLNAFAQRYDPLLDELFKELISESPYRGIPCLLQRNKIDV